MRHSRRRFRRWFRRFQYTRRWLVIQIGAVAVVTLLAACLASMAMSHSLPFS
jgi:hypothetical protein